MESFVIEGAQPLNGRIEAAGNKNGALPILAACLLTDEPVVLANLPRIRDVETMVELIADLGAEIEWTGPNEVRVHAAELTSYELDSRLASRIRASFLLAGPLLARLRRASVPPPGGDVIGRRRLDPHIHALAELGARIEMNGRYEMTTDGLRGTSIFLDEASVMATENTIMAAVVAPGHTVIGNAACEPHVQDLCRFLGSLGARIEGIGSNMLRVAGVERLGGGSWTIAPDHIEVASFIGLVAVTGGDVTIDDVVPEDLVSILPATSAGRSRSSRTAPGPRSRPTSRRSRSPSRRRRRGRSSSSRRCSRTGCSSWTSSSRWARGSFSAILTARSSPAPRACTASRWRARTSVPEWRW